MIDSFFDGKSLIKKDLLALYFSNPGKRYYIRELERKLKRPAAYIRRELIEFEKSGLFASTFVGKERFFYLDQDFFLYEDVRRMFEKQFSLEGRLRSLLQESGGVERAYIVGEEENLKIKELKNLKLLIVADLLSEETKRKVKEFLREDNREVELVVIAPDRFREREEETEDGSRGEKRVRIV
jgi:ribosomal protein L30E